MRRPVLIAALALLSGCIDFDEQEIRVAYDAEHDRIDAQLVYRGLHSSATQPFVLFGTAPEVEDAENTEKQLDQLLAEQPLFALLDPIATFDLAELRDSKEPLTSELAKLTAADRGDFFTAADGRLCGWQHLRVRDVTRALAIRNEQWRKQVADAEHGNEMRTCFGCEDDLSGALWKSALEKPEPWYERRGAELLFHVPASEPAARRLAERFERAPSLAAILEQESRSEPEAEKFAALLHAFGVTVRLREGGADLVLWDAASSVRTVDFKKPKSDGKRHDLAPHLAKRKVVPRADVTDATLAAAFAEFRAH
jgi:hypothetical protein